MYNMELQIDGEGATDQETFDPLRTPYEIDEERFPRTGSTQEEYAFLIRYAILAPSSHNTQPWKFEIRDDGIEVIPGAGN
jgi:nitroreductase